MSRSSAEPISLPARHLSILDALSADLWRKCDVARKRAVEWPKDIALPSWAATMPNPLRLRPEDPDHWLVGSLGRLGYDEVYANLLARGYRRDDRVLLLDDRKVAMFFSWRATKLEFRFDADFAHELVRTPLSGEIPAELLCRLPASCIFVSLPDGILPGYAGFYAGLDQLSKRSEPVLTIWAASESRWPSHMVDVPLAPGRLVGEVALSKEMANQERVEEFFHMAGDPEADAKAAIFARHRDQWAKARTEALGRALSCLLYLCSEEPDLPSGYRPALRREKVIGTQRRIVPPKDVIAWPVGARIGAVFRKGAEQGEPHASAESPGAAHIVRPHVRRAHWHTYWTGPKGAQKPLLRWLSPILVGTRSAGEMLPTVVRPVERASQDED